MTGWNIDHFTLWDAIKMADQSMTALQKHLAEDGVPGFEKYKVVEA
jgi:hypothetical protein